MPIKKGDKVKVEYKGALDDGTVFDSSESHGKPLGFEIGAGQIIKGFENAVVSMKKGEEKDIKLMPAEAYGEHKPQLIKDVPRGQLPKEPDPKPGMILVIATQDGRKFPARITKVNDGIVTIDLNHPLAGKTLNFRIKVVDVAS